MRLQILFRDTRLHAGEGLGQHLDEGLVRGLDRDGQGPDAKVGRQPFRVGDAPVAREARRHQHAGHLVGSERIRRDRGNQRGVDPTGETEHHVRKSVLHHVVTSPSTSAVHLVHRVEERLDPGRLARHSEVALADHHLGQRCDLRPSDGRASVHTLAHVEVDDEEVFFELTRPRDEGTLLIDDHRRAVEDQLVLTADEIHVHDRCLRVDRARREHRLAFAHPARVVRRRVDVHHDSAPPSDCVMTGPVGLQASSQTVSATRRPAITNSGPSTVDGSKYRSSSNTA